MKRKLENFDSAATIFLIIASSSALLYFINTALLGYDTGFAGSSGSESDLNTAIAVVTLYMVIGSRVLLTISGIYLCSVYGDKDSRYYFLPIIGFLMPAGSLVITILFLFLFLGR